MLYIPKHCRWIRVRIQIAILSVFCKQKFADHRTHSAFWKRWSIQNEFDKTMRLDSAVHGRWVFNDLYKWSFDKKEDGWSRPIAGQTAATYRGHDEESAGWVRTEMQHRLCLDSISRYNAAFCLGKIKAANWLTRRYCLFSHLDHRAV